MERIIQDDTVYLDLCNFILVMTKREKFHKFNNDNNRVLK